jgi:large conductance mechanosensitive channel
MSEKGIPMSLASEFREFAMRGNVVDLAVGVVIGGAFGKIVSSLVESVIMPVVSLLTAGNDFSKLAVAIGTNAKGDPLLLKYGAFIQSIVDFVIIALVIFLAIRAMNRLKRPVPVAAPAAPPPPPAQEVLLTEIRDLLAKR